MLFDRRAVMAAVFLLATAGPAAAKPVDDIADTVSPLLSATQNTVFTTQEKRIICALRGLLLRYASVSAYSRYD